MKRINYREARYMGPLHQPVAGPVVFWAMENGSRVVVETVDPHDFGWELDDLSE